MGKDSNIAWTDHTWNPWWGCSKLPNRRACDHCYAEGFAKRVGARCWGKDSRRTASPKVWSDPYAWDRAAKGHMVPPRVFCMSMGDFLEDLPELVEPRKRACGVIEETPHLQWLILTKRISDAALLPWFPSSFPSNVRMGVTCENQEAWDAAMPYLLDLKCPNFVSVEPMLGPIDTTPAERDSIDWLIVGCESRGSQLGRNMELDWVRVLRDEFAGRFFYKQGPVNGCLKHQPELDGRTWEEGPRR